MIDLNATEILDQIEVMVQERWKEHPDGVPFQYRNAKEDICALIRGMSNRRQKEIDAWADEEEAKEKEEHEAARASQNQ